jgi:hypothetical protein
VRDARLVDGDVEGYGEALGLNVHSDVSSLIGSGVVQLAGDFGLLVVISGGRDNAARKW